MKKIYLIALICFLPLSATSAFACGSGDEETCEEARPDDQFQKDVEKADKLMNSHKTAFARCNSIKEAKAFKKCIDGELMDQ